MTPDLANKIYDVLVHRGGASEYERDAFVNYHTDESITYKEWRFQGKFGFGGKYRSKYNTIHCYSENETPELLNLMNEINNILTELKTISLL